MSSSPDHGFEFQKSCALNKEKRKDILQLDVLDGSSSNTHAVQVTRKKRKKEKVIKSMSRNFDMWQGDEDRKSVV